MIVYFISRYALMNIYHVGILYMPQRENVPGQKTLIGTKLITLVDATSSKIIRSNYIFVYS